MSGSRRWLRWLARGLLLVAALPALLALVVVLVLGTTTGRARLLAVVLAQVNAHIPGRIEVDSLDGLGPGGVALRGARLFDPRAKVVLELGTLDAELEPFALLDGKVVLKRVALDRARVDLRGIDAPDHGLLAALVNPAAPATPVEPRPPPYVRVEAIVVSGLDVEAPELAPPWRALRVKGLNAMARFVLDGAPEVRLSSLDGEITRGDRALARVERLEGVWARPGAGSELSLALGVGSVRVDLSARGVLPPAPEHASAPLGAELHVAGLTAPELGALLDDATLDEAFAGPLSLELVASGTLAELALRGGIDTAAGRIDLNGSLRDRLQVALRAVTEDLVLARLRPELPAEPLTLALEAATDISDPTRLPITLSAMPGRFGAFTLPSLDARATWTGESARDLSVSLEQGKSRVSLRGNADVAGTVDVHVGADVSPAELRAVAMSAGIRAAPHAALGADVRLTRSRDGGLSIRGDVRAGGVRLPQLSLDHARVHLALDGPPEALAGRADVQLRGLLQGSLRVPHADFALTASGGEYRARGSAEIDRSSVAFELRGRPLQDRWTLDGDVRGRWEETPFALRIGQTTLSPLGWVETRGIDVDAGEQQLHVVGSVGRPRSELVVSAPSLELGRLARLAGLPDAWRGRAALEARLRGEIAAPVLELQLAAHDVARGVAPPLSARVAVQLDAEAGRASVDTAIDGGSGASWIDASFTLASEFRPGVGWERELHSARQRATLELRALDLHALGRWIARPIPVSAQVGLSASLEGTLRQPVLHARMRAALHAGLGLPALQLEHALDYAEGALNATLDVDDAAGRWLSLGAQLGLSASDAADLLALAPRLHELGDSARWSVRLDAARRRVGALWTDAPDTIAGVELDARAQLSHEPGAEPAGRASVHLGGARLPSSPERCTDAGAELALEGTLADRRLEAALTATHRGTQLLAATAMATVQLAPLLRGGAATLGTIDSQLTSQGLDLEKVPYLCGRVRGRLDAKVTLSDPLGSAPSLAAQLKATGLSLGAEPSLGVELSAHAARGMADADVRVVGPRGASSLSARVPIQWASGRFALAADAPLSGHARLVALPIAPLLDPAGAVSHATGWLSGSVDVGGTLAEPEPSGTLELEHAELTATALAQPLHGVRGRVTFDRRALSIERFEARDRDGKLALSGRVDRRGPGALDLTLDLVAEQFPLRQRGQIVATTSGHAAIQAGIEPSRTTVAVKLVDADTWLEKAQARTGIDLSSHPDFVITAPAAAGGSQRTASSAATGAAAAAGSDEGPVRESRVRLDASDRFWIKRDDFAIQLSTQLDAVIRGEQAKITGKVDINRGYFDLMGRVFDVERGSQLEFIGSTKPDPVVDISAAYEHRSSGKTVKVQITGRGSKPVLTFFIDEGEVSAGEVLELLLGGRGSSGGEEATKNQATSFVSALTAGLLATSARRELGAAAPIIMIEPGEHTGDGRIRAGFELDALVPSALRQLITGVYVEGIVEREGSNDSRGQSQDSSTQAGVLLELYFPHQLFSTGQWGPGTTWSLDWGWQL